MEEIYFATPIKGLRYGTMLTAETEGKKESRALLQEILKQKMKMKILKRRHSNGLDDIHIDFEPKKPQPMTEEELGKDKRRRESNRKSANKSRQKEKEQREKYEKILKEYEDKHSVLLNKIRQMEKQKCELMDRLKRTIPEFSGIQSVVTTNSITDFLANPSFDSAGISPFDSVTTVSECEEESILSVEMLETINANEDHIDAFVDVQSEHSYSRLLSNDSDSCNTHSTLSDGNSAFDDGDNRYREETDIVLLNTFLNVESEAEEQTFFKL